MRQTPSVSCRVTRKQIYPPQQIQQNQNIDRLYKVQNVFDYFLHLKNKKQFEQRQQQLIEGYQLFENLNIPNNSQQNKSKSHQQRTFKITHKSTHSQNQLKQSQRLYTLPDTRDTSRGIKISSYSFFDKKREQ